MPRFRVSYTFVDTFTGDEDAIRRAIRDLSFSPTFKPEDVTGWEVFDNPINNQFKLNARRMIEEEVWENTPKAAVRKFLYNLELPGDIDFQNIEVVQLPAEAEVVNMEGDAA